MWNCNVNVSLKYLFTFQLFRMHFNECTKHIRHHIHRNNFYQKFKFSFNFNLQGTTTPMMKGWFDAFRDDGGPTLYSFSNRTPVTFDVSIVAVSLLFATLYVAFLVIFPGVRKQVSSFYFHVYLTIVGCEFCK